MIDPHQRFVGKKVPPKENLEDRGLGRALEFRIFHFNFAYQDGSTRGVLTVRTGDNTIYGGKPPYADKCCFVYIAYSWYTALITNIKCCFS